MKAFELALNRDRIPRTMTREQWRQVSRWLRRVQRAVETEFYRCDQCGKPVSTEEACGSCVSIPGLGYVATSMRHVKCEGV